MTGRWRLAAEVALRTLFSGFSHVGFLAQKNRISTSKRHLWRLSATKVTQLEFCHVVTWMKCMIKYTLRTAENAVRKLSATEFGQIRGENGAENGRV